MKFILKTDRPCLEGRPTGLFKLSNNRLPGIQMLARELKSRFFSHTELVSGSQISGYHYDEILNNIQNDDFIDF